MNMNTKTNTSTKTNTNTASRRDRREGEIWLRKFVVESGSENAGLDTDYTCHNVRCQFWEDIHIWSAGLIS